MWIGSLALAGIGIPGVFGFAGFYSKDVILESAWGAHSGVGQYAFWLGVIAALLTAFYSWRLLFMTFHGPSRADHHTLEHAHESPWIMLAPLVVLAIGAAFAGFAFEEGFVGAGIEHFWAASIPAEPHHHALEAAHHAPVWVKWAPLIVALLGIGLAYVFYIRMPWLPQIVATIFRPVYLLFLNKWYFDELYDWLFVRPAQALGFGFWKSGDGAIIDGIGPDGIAAATLRMARRAGRLQSGYVYHYAFAMLIGVVALLTWYLFAHGR
jgi:NADH-quinone oxidoreductase subunit L